MGDVSLFVIASFQDGTTYRSKPIDIRIEKPALLAAINRDRKSNKKGLKAEVRYNPERNREVVIKKLKGPFSELGKDKKGISSMQFEGEFYVDKKGFYQLVISTRGHVKVQIDSSAKLDAKMEAGDGDLFLPLNLESGWHSLVIELTPKGLPRLRAVLSGAQVAAVLEGDMLRH
jgi:hypothetical protein